MNENLIQWMRNKIRKNDSQLSDIATSVDKLNEGTVKKTLTYDVTPSSTISGGIFIINKPLVSGYIKNINFYTSGTNGLKVYILKQDATDSTKFTVISKTSFVSKVGLSSCDTYIELLEDNLYIGVSGSLMYAGSVVSNTNATNWYQSTVDYNVNDIFTTTHYTNYIQFCINFNIVQLSVTKTDIAPLQEICDTITSDSTTNHYLKHLLNKAICIGDSLTQGVYGSDAVVHTENYPYFLSKLLNNITIVNNGHAGYTPTGIWNQYTKNIDFTNKPDLILIMLGTNEGLTDTLTADTTITEVQTYEDYANTNTGNYCKIIEYCKAQSPDSIIILCTTPYPNLLVENQTFITTNSVIKQIATKYSLKVFDIYNDCKLNSSIYHTDDNIHFNKLGYLKIANYIFRQSISYLEDDNVAVLIKAID